MKLTRALETLNLRYPVKHGGTTMPYGSLVQAGTTAETNLGLLIVASSAAADTVGVLKQQYASTETDSTASGTVWTRKTLEHVAPMYVLDMDYDTSDTMAVASTSSTTVTITSLEDNIDTSWLYAVSGTGQYGVYFIDTSASGSCTTKTATGWDSTTTCLKILRLFHQLAKLNTAATKIGTDAAAGSWTCLILNNYVLKGGKKFDLDPTLHNGLTFDAATRIVAQVGVRNALSYTID